MFVPINQMDALVMGMLSLFFKNKGALNSTTRLKIISYLKTMVSYLNLVTNRELLNKNSHWSITQHKKCIQGWGYMSVAQACLT